ncbi:hypothetical protein HYALB_00000818 [Hymenoscyphus albidus]|uniref:EthD domain-containing protein n=1 Tax=Hymenoscyphus albidus TaxID=595503 RepID=A0A9N9LE59_9HELO|nr:hypothetical protein HYALB_00000818 [Hymenoscyphus albidus]
MAENSKTEKRPLKYTVTHYRKAQHTHEEFMKWVVETHLPLAMLIFKRHGILSYSLFTTPASLNEPLRAEIGKMRPTWEFADFDCFIEYLIPDMQAIMKVLGDADWQVAVRDQDEWLESKKALVSLGYLTTYLRETGEVVNMKE